MATAAAIVVAALRANSSIAALCGNRHFPGDAVPKFATVPYTDYQVVSNEPDEDLNGRISGYDATVAIEMVCNSRSQAETLRALFPAAIKAIAGTTVAGEVVLDARATSDGDEVSGPIEFRGGVVFICNVRISIYYGGS